MLLGARGLVSPAGRSRGSGVRRGTGKASGRWSLNQETTVIHVRFSTDALYFNKLKSRSRNSFSWFLKNKHEFDVLIVQLI